MVEEYTGIAHAFFGHPMIVFYDILATDQETLLTILLEIFPELAALDGFCNID